MFSHSKKVNKSRDLKQKCHGRLVPQGLWGIAESGNYAHSEWQASLVVA